jgi:hypothetical protein
MPRAKGSKKQRFSLWIPGEVLEDLTRQQEATGKGSVAEVLREAVEVYRSLLKARDDGVNLFFEDSATGEKGRVWLLPGPHPLPRPKR